MWERAKQPIDDFVNSKGIAHEIVVVVVSYLFVFAGAWNDGYVGLIPSPASGIIEFCMAAILVMEITSRLLFARERRLSFYALIVLDVVSLLTVVPVLTGFAFARLFRLGYASWRTVLLLERLARSRNNAMYLAWIYILIVPMAAAMLFAVESHAGHSPVRNYFDALAMTVGYALTLGSSRPTTYAGNIICGVLFVGGVLCIGIIGNTLANRYHGDDSKR
ncbi:MAG TPA: hypothetical protein VGK84_06695 [Candidatus Tumulicola sp.]|jgi:hypothetical protein